MSERTATIDDLERANKQLKAELLAELLPKMATLLNPEKLISVAEFCKRTGYKTSTVIKMCNNGEIAATQNNRSRAPWQILSTEVDRLLTEARANLIAQPKSATKRHNILINHVEQNRRA
jgi:hypothetical protein